MTINEPISLLRPHRLHEAKLLEPMLTLNSLLSSVQESRPKQNTDLASLFGQLPLLAFGHLSTFFLATFSAAFLFSVPLVLPYRRPFYLSFWAEFF